MSMLKRVLCEIIDVIKSKEDQIEISQRALKILGINYDNVPTNYGKINIKSDQNQSSAFSIKFNSILAQKLDVAVSDYIDILNINNSLYFIPISLKNLTNYFFNVHGANNPKVILLSSHAEFEPHTREIATRIHKDLQKLNIPTLRIELQKKFIDWNQNIDITLSRYDVDITRKADEPEIIADKLVNKNLSYRIVAQIYFRLLTQSLSPAETKVVVDIHGIATASKHGIAHPMVLVGDAFSRNPIVKSFTKRIQKSSKNTIPNLWIVYRPPWGSIEYSLHLVRKLKSIPIIIEVRRDLRDNPEIRNHLIQLISNSLRELIQNFPLKEQSDSGMIAYRPFVEEDLTRVLFIYKKGYFILYKNQVRHHAEMFLELFRAALEEGVEGELLIAEKNGVPVGFATIHKESEDEWKFGPIAIIPSEQHQGIGSHLLQKCLDYAHSKQARQVYLKVHEHNQAAINLYKKAEFFVAGTLPSNIKERKYFKMILRFQ